MECKKLTGVISELSTIHLREFLVLRSSPFIITRKEELAAVNDKLNNGDKLVSRKTLNRYDNIIFSF